MKFDSIQRAALAAATTLLLATASAGQERLPFQHQTEGLPQTSGSFGEVIRGLGDIDGDGYDDYAVGARHWPYPTAEGAVFVYSGRRGTTIVRIDGDQQGSDFGVAIAEMPDVDGDLVPEFVIGSPSFNAPVGNNAGRVELRAGADGAVLWTSIGVAGGADFGRSVFVVPDLSGDSFPDVVTSEHRYSSVPGAGLGRVRFLDGQTGIPFADADGIDVFSDLGKTLLAGPAGIYAGTGTGKIYVVSAPVAGVASITKLYDPPVGVGSPQQARMDFMRGPGGVTHLIVGRPTDDTGGFTNNGTVEVFLPGSLSPLLSISGASSFEFLGFDVSRVFDMDGDGVDEVGYSAYPIGSTPARFRAASLAGGILEDISYAIGGQGALSAIRDVTGDGRGELLVGAANGVSLTYEAKVYSQGLAAPVVTTGASGLAATFALDAGASHAGRVYVQLYSFAGSDPGFLGPAAWPLVPLNPDASTSSILLLAGTPSFPDAIGLLDGAGTSSTSMSVDASVASALAGARLTTTVVVLDLAANVAHATNPGAVDFP